jgi:hypothetical protein
MGNHISSGKRSQPTRIGTSPLKEVIAEAGNFEGGSTTEKVQNDLLSDPIGPGG